MAFYTGVIGCGDVVIICLLVAQLAVMLTSLYAMLTEAR